MTVSTNLKRTEEQDLSAKLGSAGHSFGLHVRGLRKKANLTLSDLSIASDIIKSHGGKINLTRSSANGLSVEIILPF